MRRSGSVTLGPELRRERERAGISLRELADSIGTSKSYLSRLERGMITNPSAETLQRVGLALGVSISLGAPPATLLNNSLAYEPPILLQEEHVAGEGCVGEEAISELAKAFSDVSIPMQARTMLEEQVIALVQIARRHESKGN